MNKYGQNNFSIEVLEECSEDLIAERETYWIEYYQSFKNGYNATIGGDGRPYLDRELILSLYHEGKLIQDIAKLTGYDQGSISKILTNYGISAKEKNLRAKATFSRPVVMIDLETEEELKIFVSAGEARKFLNKNYQGAATHIRSVCSGDRKSAFGYKWRFNDTL